MDSLETDKLNIATKTKLGTQQVKNTVAVSALDNAKITKVLTASAKPRIENINVGNAEVKFDGVVDYDFLVVLDNNEIVPLTQKSNFSSVFESTDITPNTAICINACVIELNNVSNIEIVYSAVINFDIFATNSNAELAIASAVENVFTKEGEITFNNFVGDVTYDGRVDFEVAKDSKVNKILYTCSEASIKAIIPSNDYFVATGEVCTTIVYESDDGLIRSMLKENAFSEEIEARGSTKESCIQACIATKETIVVENGEKNVFSFDVPIQITAQIFNKRSQNCIVDAYSLQYDVNLTTTSFDQDEFLSTRQIEDNILTTFSFDEGLQPIDRILAVIPSNISIINQIIKDGILLLEGIANVNIIYYSLDEEGSDVLNSIDIEIPYSLSFEVDDLRENDKVFARITLDDINVKNKMGRELEIMAGVKVNYDITRRDTSAVITNLALGDEKPQKDFALEIYLARENQTLWDIAKELNISTADLVNQNGELTLPLKPGEKIVAYRQRVVDFE